MSTIQLPKNWVYLTDRLPKANYLTTDERQRRKTSAEYNTLPSLKHPSSHTPENYMHDQMIDTNSSEEFTPNSREAIGYKAHIKKEERGSHREKEEKSEDLEENSERKLNYVNGRKKPRITHASPPQGHLYKNSQRNNKSPIQNLSPLPLHYIQNKASHQQHSLNGRESPSKQGRESKLDQHQSIPLREEQRKLHDKDIFNRRIQSESVRRSQCPPKGRQDHIPKGALYSQSNKTEETHDKTERSQRNQRRQVQRNKSVEPPENVQLQQSPKDRINLKPEFIKHNSNLKNSDIFGEKNIDENLSSDKKIADILNEIRTKHSGKESILVQNKLRNIRMFKKLYKKHFGEKVEDPHSLIHENKELLKNKKAEGRDFTRNMEIPKPQKYKYPHH